MIWFYWYRLCALSRFKYSKSMCLKFVRVAINAIEITQIKLSPNGFFLRWCRWMCVCVLHCVIYTVHAGVYEVYSSRVSVGCIFDCNSSPDKVELVNMCRKAKRARRNRCISTIETCANIACSIWKTVCLIRTDREKRNNFTWQVFCVLFV